MSSDGANVFDVEELSQIRTRCRELRKEKDMLRQSQSQSFDLIKRLELHVKSLSESRMADREHIQKLERERMNCYQEIDYLQDQLNARNTEVDFLSDHVHSLELKLADMEHIQDKSRQLEEELRRSNSERLLMMEELQSREEELQYAALCIEKLEESISSSALEFQCEIESLKLDMMALEHTCFEAKKTQNEYLQEKAKMESSIEELKDRFEHAQETIAHLDEENNELREKLATSERSARLFCQKVEELVDGERRQLNAQLYVREFEQKLAIAGEMSACGEVFGALLLKLESALAPDGDLKKKMDSMTLEIHEYEQLVKQLKDELREEKFKAKDEAEDLAQEMAELRYQMTNMLEEECKRRACIEQASLQRIAELEAQIQKEHKKCSVVIRHLPEA